MALDFRAMAKGLAITMGLALSTASGTLAQDQNTSNRVGVHSDWNVFEETSPRECMSVSAPKETVNTRDGRVVAVRRSAIRLFVFFRPEKGKAGHVTFTGGYPFAPDSYVNLEIGDQKFNLITQGEWAWPTTEDDDAKIITAMKRGANATLTARSARGNQTKDTFSLRGFTAAFEDADKRCN